VKALKSLKHPESLDWGIIQWKVNRDVGVKKLGNFCGDLVVHGDLMSFLHVGDPPLLGEQEAAISMTAGQETKGLVESQLQSGKSIVSVELILVAQPDLSSWLLNNLVFNLFPSLL
jgi:hypothetical protein